MLIKFLKTRDVKSPNRANQFDAGIDFFVPEFTETFIKDTQEKNPFISYDRVSKKFVLRGHERILIPAGIKCRMEEPGRALIAANKSGVASKKGLIYGAQVVDFTYKGEIHINVINTSNKPVEITPGMKLIQFLETPIFSNPVEVFEDGSSYCR